MKNTIQKAQQGFTLIELMIVVAIIGILASVAIPSYQNYTKKAKFTEVVLASSAAKIGVEMCAQMTNTVTGCNGATNGIPANITDASGMVKTVTTLNGTITVVPVAANGITEAETYIMVPTLTAGKVTWNTSTGGCVAAAIC